MAPTVGADIPIGSIVEVQAGRGIVRFAGTTQFAPGRWIGVELDEPKGKNDGSVQGVSYFDCKPTYGMFVRAAQIRSVEVPQNAAGPSSGPVRPTHRLNESISKAPTFPAPPAIARANSAQSSESSRPASPQRPGIPSKGPRLAPPTPLKRSVSSQMPTQTAPGNRLPPHPPSAMRVSTSVQQQVAQLPSRRVSLVPSMSAPSNDSDLEFISPSTAAETRHHAQPIQTPEHERPLTPDELVMDNSPPTQTIAVPDDSHELRVKVRVLETKRADDARRIRELEGRLAEAETFVALRPKLQAKLQSLQTENMSFKRRVADHATMVATLEKKLEDQAEQLELMMLDKEVAEERAEVAEGELETEKEAKAEILVELEVWRKDGIDRQSGAINEGQAGRSEIAFRQLEKQNERLKEALVRLRDLTHETDAEQRRRISDLERELGSLDDVQDEFNQARMQLEHADLQIEDLKQQLDAALESEDMLVQLTDKNMQMSEKIEEMRITIEDLEALRELNDELEETHLETEKSLTEEIEQKEASIREQEKQAQELQESLVDYESTVSQFRDLVTNLQSELDGLREKDQSRQSESQAQATQSAALMSMNIKLQSTASKNQAKTIDLELRRLDAVQARELLDITQPYLPEVYLESDQEATKCYMFFQRLSFKADLINSVVANQYGFPDSLDGAVTEQLVGICDMRQRIAHLSALCKRFTAVMRRAVAETFLNAARLLPEISPLEKKVDAQIDLLRKDEFRERACAEVIEQILQQFEHLSDTYFSNDEYDVGERELDIAAQIDHDLDTFHATIAMTKTTLNSYVSQDDVEIDSGDYDMDLTFFKPLQEILETLRPPRSTSRKLLKRVEDLVASNMALKVKVVPHWRTMANSVSHLVEFGMALAREISAHVTDLRHQQKPFQVPTVLGIVLRLAKEALGPQTSPWNAVVEAVKMISRELLNFSPMIMQNDDVFSVTSNPAPWVTRIQDIKAMTAVNVDAERALVKLNDEVLILVRGVKTRDQTIQESAAKIELMERRMETVKMQADAISALERQLAAAHDDEKSRQEAIDSLEREVTSLEQECSRLKQQLLNSGTQTTSGLPINDGEGFTLETTADTSRLLEQIENLRGTVRFLRNENSFLKGQDLLRGIYSLPSLPTSQLPTPPASPTAASLDVLHQAPFDADSKPNVRSLATEAKLLYHDVAAYASSLRVVDCSKSSHVRGNRWHPQSQSPAVQLLEQRLRGERLAEHVKNLIERTSALRLASF